MESHTRNFKIRLGLFIAGGIALFIIGVFIIGKQQNMFNPVFKLTSTFYNVSGLQVGNNVRFSGINVGTVDNIHIIDDSTVMVQMLIRENVKQFIKSDAKVALGSEGLIGARLIVITQGSSDAPMVEEGQHIASIEPVEMDDIIASIQITAGHAEVITQELAGIMTQVNSGEGTLGKLIHDPSLAKTIDHTVANFERSSRELTKVMVKVNSGEGTLGKLIHDAPMAENISQTVNNFKNTSKGLEETIDAVQNSFLLRGYFNRKAREKVQEKEEAAEQVKAEGKNPKEEDQ